MQGAIRYLGYADESSPEPVETLTIEAGQFGDIEVDIKYRVLRQGLNAVPFFRRKNAKLAGFNGQLSGAAIWTLAPARGSIPGCR
jgi:hypothetical protein